MSSYKTRALSPSQLSVLSQLMSAPQGRLSAGLIRGPFASVQALFDRGLIGVDMGQGEVWIAECGRQSFAVGKDLSRHKCK